MSAERVLERCIHLAASGLKNPGVVLVEAAKRAEGEDHAAAMRAVMKAAGGSLAAWYGPGGEHRTVADAVRLFEDALFAVQVG